MSITIKKQGLFDTLQDEGRYGYQHLGINPGGVMDDFASKVANMLVGNEPDEAVIEMHFPASVFYFEKACVIALSGADFSAFINDKPVPLHTTIIVSASSTLEFKQYKTGARCYFAVQGGWNADYWLNSYSTDVKVKAGGFDGAALKKNQTLHCKAEQFYFQRFHHGDIIITNIQADTKHLYPAKNMVRYINGPEHNLLDNSSIQAFNSSAFTISLQSDRMGYRLNGPLLKTSVTQIISSAVTKGTIQLLPDGNLIILMAGHQTTGGYPRIAQVVASDIPSLAQMQPNTSINFTHVSVNEAEKIFIQRQQYLQDIAAACNFQLKEFLAAYDFNRS